MQPDYRIASFTFSCKMWDGGQPDCRQMADGNLARSRCGVIIARIDAAINPDVQDFKDTVPDITTPAIYARFWIDNHK